MADRERIVEELGDLIYKTLKGDEVTKDMGNRAYITDILSQAIIKEGYTCQPESPSEPRKRRPEQPGLDGNAAGYVFKATEPAEDMVEAVGKIIKDKLIAEMWAEPALDGVCDRCNNNDVRWDSVYATESLNKAVHEILNLFPEYELVELEALGNEEIMGIFTGIKREKLPVTWFKAISEATCRKNNKGQLYRVKEKE